MKKKSLLTLLAFALLAQIGLAQKKFPEKVDLDWEGFKCQLPKDWRNDPYGSSSVCDCAGVIFDNFKNELRINIYFTDKEGLLDPMRDEVWSYKWAKQESEVFEYKNAAGIKFVGQNGRWEPSEEENGDGNDHMVIRLDGGINSHQMMRIFIFGPEKDVLHFQKDLNAWLDTITMKKVKRD